MLMTCTRTSVRILVSSRLLINLQVTKFYHLRWGISTLNVEQFFSSVQILVFTEFCGH